jgi:hypothetical protein
MNLGVALEYDIAITNVRQNRRSWFEIQLAL